jgi:hypothetical protein
MSNEDSHAELIKLNIRGRIFEIPLALANTSPKLQNLLKNTKPIAGMYGKPARSIPYINRDPTQFNRILNFMEDGSVAYVGQPELTELIDEANYYELTVLFNILTKRRAGTSLVGGNRSKKATKRRRKFLRQKATKRMHRHRHRAL